MVKLCRQDNIEKYKIEYDLFNRMVKYTKGTDVYTYTYNGDGQRMSKTAHGFTTKFVWDGKNMVYEYIDAMNNTWYYYGNGVEVQLSADNLKEMEVYNKNAYGDIVSVNGWQTLYVVGMEFSYDAYGNEIEEYYNADGYAGCSFRYRGEYYDGETGFYYLRNRYYDPKKGRFITEDPIRDGNNWYVYCNGNPVLNIDPTGLDSWILYDVNAVSGDGEHVFEDEARIYEQELSKKYGTPVHLIYLNNAQEFQNAWNLQVGYDENGNSVTIDEVRIILHGSASGEKDDGVGYMMFSDGSRIAANVKAIENWDTDKAVCSLDYKNIGVLYFSSCNSGNLDIYNTAWAFKNCMTIREYIVAWDGGTIFDYNENRLKAGGIGSTQAIWEFYVERNIFGWPCRSRMGRRQIWT